MPTYEYLCESCGSRFERFQPISAKPVRNCPECGKKVRRLIHGGAGVIFKGSGFYQTDYRSKSYTEAAKKDSPEKKTESTPPCGTSACKQPDVCSPKGNK